MPALSPPYKAEVYRIMPDDFSATIDVAACYIHSANRYLMLHRAKGTSEEYTWGPPAGKLEIQETPRCAVIREVQEETGISLDSKGLQEIGTLYGRHPHMDFTFHVFKQKYVDHPEVRLSDEHHDYCWATVEEVLGLPLTSGGKEFFNQFLALMPQPALPRKEFYFLRHGETDVNADPHVKRVDYDLPLNKRGIEQAIAARQIVSKLPIKAIRSSPIQRATQTRDIILETLDAGCHTEDDCLSECKAEVWTKMIQLENGVGYEVCSAVQNFLSRALTGVQTALQGEGPTLIVAHGGVHWAICYHMGIKDHPWKIGNCEAVHFRPAGSGRWEATILT